ncbi:antibiotic biosynthesis monooxygenase [Congregibacter brevis]|uniref:Antibiotic biosynthesis monooxygenase n=1 Tax=Congregibacter brevis TaxID=3081201 RepID=A0ABZ0IA12_9GAMM|nr:antibiotic biosynthesis monooxygenase [Congregibacter sp. IMCC45268]
MRIVLKGHIAVPKSDLKAILSELPTHIVLTQAEPGCVEFRVIQRTHEPCVFDVYEEFESADAFDAHQLRVRDSMWAHVTQRAERHYQVSAADPDVESH